jgi:hypothetical protein
VSLSGCLCDIKCFCCNTWLWTKESPPGALMQRARVRGRTRSGWRQEPPRQVALVLLQVPWPPFLTHPLVPSSFFFSWKHQDTTPGLHEKFSMDADTTTFTFTSHFLQPIGRCATTVFLQNCFLPRPRLHDQRHWQRVQRCLLHLSRQGV